MQKKIFCFSTAKLDVLIIATLYIKHLTKLTQIPAGEDEAIGDSAAGQSTPASSLVAHGNGEDGHRPADPPAGSSTQTESPKEVSGERNLILAGNDVCCYEDFGLISLFFCINRFCLDPQEKSGHSGEIHSPGFR